MKAKLLFSVVLTAAALMLGGLRASGETMPAADSRITYIGRTLASDGSVSFDWTGVYLRIRFEGSSLSVRLSDSHKDYFNVWVDSSMDQAPDRVIATFGQDSTLTLFSADKKRAKRIHQVILQKRTEGNQGRVTLHEFITDGTFLPADAPKGRIIEYIGDSYTCGYGTEASNKERFSAETENQNYTYACVTARYFGAEQMVMAHSGMGIARNYNGKLTDDNMTSRYLKTFDSAEAPDWTPGELKPDITVIYLGTNDFSTSLQPSQRVFVRNYIQLLKEIKDYYGEGHPILCMVPKHDVLLFEYIKKAVDTCGFSGVHILGLSPSVHNNEEDMGADGHPNYSGHRKIAYTVIPCIATITGWELSSIPG